MIHRITKGMSLELGRSPSQSILRTVASASLCGLSETMIGPPKDREKHLGKEFDIFYS